MTPIKYDPHHHEQQYKGWKEKGQLMQGISKENRSLIIKFLEDMELGANISPSSKKGARSYGRLRNIKSKLHTLALIFEKEININSFEELSNKERELMALINRMREGKIKARANKGKPLTAIGTYVKTLKAFWHWYMRVSKKDGKIINDITIDLDGKDNKPKFHYFTIDQLRQMTDKANYFYKVLMMFMFDSGIRSPTELMNVRAKDLELDEKKGVYSLNIREETSKTFGRKIKLMLCSGLLKEYLKDFKPDTPLFKRAPKVVNQYLKNIGFKVLNIGKASSKVYANRKYKLVEDGITMYDFRHSSACYWLPRYKSESALKYRFGWKKSDMIHYYTELLGMKDTIEQEDLYIDVTKTELENELKKERDERTLLNERLKALEQDMKDMKTSILKNIIKNKQK